jgi:hypothetical protein
VSCPACGSEVAAEAAHGWGRVVDLVRALRHEWWFERTVEVVNRARRLGP